MRGICGDFPFGVFGLWNSYQVFKTFLTIKWWCTGILHQFNLAFIVLTLTMMEGSPFTVASTQTDTRASGYKTSFYVGYNFHISLLTCLASSLLNCWSGNVTWPWSDYRGLEPSPTTVWVGTFRGDLLTLRVTCSETPAVFISLPESLGQTLLHVLTFTLDHLTFAGEKSTRK